MPYGRCALVFQVSGECSGLQFNLTDEEVFYAAKIWQLTLEATASVDWPTWNGASPFFYAHLLWGYSLLDYIYTTTFSLHA